MGDFGACPSLTVTHHRLEGTPNAGRLAREKKMLNYLNREYAIFIS